jgi:hypothetical protein
VAYPSDVTDDDLPAIELPSPRPPSIFLVTLLAVPGVLLLLAPFAFAFVTHRHAAPQSPPGTVEVDRSATTASLLTYSATAGPGCPSAPSASYHRVGNFFNDHIGWLHFGAGCIGQADAIPLSGDPATANPTLYAEWDFRTDPVTRGSCRVEVYVSEVDDIVYNGGDPAHYVVYPSIDGGDPVRTFTVVEQIHLANWVALGTVPVTRAELRIVATNQGSDSDGTVPTYRHVSVGAVKVTCS